MTTRSTMRKTQSTTKMRARTRTTIWSAAAETRQRPGGDRHEFNSGIEHADRQNRVGLKQCSAAEKPREGRPMGQFVGAVEDERTAGHIGGEKPETESD